MADERRSESRRGKNPRSIQNLRPVKPGEIRNPEGKNGYTAALRFRRAFEAAATDRDLEAIVKGLIFRAKRGEKVDVSLVVERLWPKIDRLELGDIGETESQEREAVRSKLQRLLEAKRGSS